jgi:hypothetical protein
MSESKAYVPPSRRKFNDEKDSRFSSLQHPDESELRLKNTKNFRNEDAKNFERKESIIQSKAGEKDKKKPFCADDFPELEVFPNQKDNQKAPSIAQNINTSSVASEPIFLKDCASSYLSVLEKPAEIVNVENKVKKKTNILVAKKPVVHFDKRTYDKDGWMTNDDWLFWYEFNNPSKIGSF